MLPVWNMKYITPISVCTYDVLEHNFSTWFFIHLFPIYYRLIRYQVIISIVTSSMTNLKRFHAKTDLYGIENGNGLKSTPCGSLLSSLNSIRMHLTSLYFETNTPKCQNIVSKVVEREISIVRWTMSTGR